MRVLLGILIHGIVKLYFRNLSVVHPERWRRSGPVLVAANHPATWTDVAVLDVALGRRLHFLAHESLFRPWWRRWIMEIHGTVPIAPLPPGLRPQARRAAARKAFERCHELFDRGQAVAVFPEGVSAGDRDVRPLKTGAARIALGYLDRGAGSLTVIPVGLLYTDRTRPRSDVEVVVGAPLRVDASSRSPELEEAVHDLTRQLERRLKHLIFDVDARRALRLPPPVLASGAARPGLALRLVAGAIPAAIGAAVHLAPWAAVEVIARWLAPEPHRISFARILAGLVLFPLSYAALGWLLVDRGMPAIALAFLWPGWVVLGWFTHVYGGFLSELSSVARLRAIRRRWPGLLQRGRAARARILGLLDRAAREGAKEPG